MAYWTNKHWGVAIGAAIVLSITILGAGVTALAVLAAVAGYFAGKFLDGELDLEEVRDQARGLSGREQRDGAAAPGASADATQVNASANASARSAQASRGRVR